MIAYPPPNAVGATAKQKVSRPADRVAIGIAMLATIVGAQWIAWLTV